MFTSTYNWKKVSIDSKNWWNYLVGKLNTKKNKIGNVLNPMKKKNNTKKFKEYRMRISNTKIKKLFYEKHNARTG